MIDFILKVSKASLFRTTFLFVFQSYYSDYYSRYLEEYERRQNCVPSSTDPSVGESIGHTCDKGPETIGRNIEAALLMDDIMNNGINFCAIM